MTTRNDVVLGRAGLLVLALLVSVVARVGNSAEVPVAAGNSTSPTQRLQFETDVVPILRAYCWKCHGGEGRVGGLDTRTLPLLLAGGKSGAAIVRGAAEKSLLFQKLASRQMPPGNELKPTDAHVATIRAWLDARAVAAYEGGPLTPDEAPPIEALDREWWAFRKPVRPQVPTTVSPLEKRGNGGCHRWRTPIDLFVIRQLEEKGLSFAADADPLTLVRRVSLDLIGLPPSPREVDAFLNDQAPDAYENLVERLLASPHYGERWGRHWLDAAGYVDTIGSDNDAAIIEERERIWKYRDYVIRSFNHDKPFDRFLVEQLAAASLLDLAYETAATQKLYGLENPATKAYGLRCLLARKLIETGVRFVQIHPKPFQPWDTHANTQSSLVDICGNTDLPTAGLIRDLKQRGLLDQTIVIWSGEFGRLPVSQNGTGRDHNRNAFSLLAAGGGFKPGFVFGETDEVGYRAAENRVSVADFHATVLYQLGLDHESLTFHHSGRDETLTDASLTDARVVHELLT